MLAWSGCGGWRGKAGSYLHPAKSMGKRKGKKSLNKKIIAKFKNCSVNLVIFNIQYM